MPQVTETEPCWYCQRVDAVLWCDYQLGGVHGPPEQLPLPIDRVPWQEALGSPYMTDREISRMLFDMRLSSPIATCDAAACRACSVRFGWRFVTHFGEHTVDHCHHHADAGFGRTLFIGNEAAESIRAEVRALCARATFAVVSSRTTCHKQ